ncbi:tryptophanase isoform X1 [Nematostella vectensis]|uniref:tryptophanase isoform X1 n=1 Tax=Nematostella vectensis TaxID=45351 RepID=UPI00207786F9|nr:tryptophanase isoform X1 [Nematostella vectensis]XP_032240172.2 tryptophanase isoform X1 [Nematostella vectensis]XP_048584661.1 tryptophanase isoform X1 [Nematostella vectensis]XP_048584662.1 tryptophanase isoform X1 [Nematostella vectensis]
MFAKMENYQSDLKTNFEPFRIKSVETIKLTSREERLQYLAEASYNPFKVKSDHITIDLLTDSGTGAMSSHQWSALMLGDEAYAGSRSFHKFEEVVKKIYGYRHVIPTHQGRAAERILFKCMLEQGDIVPNNAHFDTTRANVEAVGAVAINLPVPEALDPQHASLFKGNMDVQKLSKLLTSEKRKKVKMVIITITNNALGGSPVSMSNIRAVSKLCRAHGVPMYFDACRFAENAWFIKTNETGYENKTPLEIAQEMFSHADGCTMSAKKNGLANIGGFITLNNDEIADKCCMELVISEGFVTYGGLAGRDLEAIAVGLDEILDASYLRYQINQVQYLADMLQQRGVPVLTPPGGHAVYIDAGAMLPHIPTEQFPAWALNCSLYIEGGIRGGELGGVMHGDQANDHDNDTPDGEGEGVECRPELVRLAIPRRTYTESHLRYVADVFGHIYKHRHVMTGYRITWAAKVLRHFTARLEPIASEKVRGKNHMTEAAQLKHNIVIQNGAVIEGMENGFTLD